MGMAEGSLINRRCRHTATGEPLTASEGGTGTVGRGDIVDPAASEKGDFSVSGENYGSRGHLGAIRVPKAG